MKTILLSFNRSFFLRHDFVGGMLAIFFLVSLMTMKHGGLLVKLVPVFFIGPWLLIVLRGKRPQSPHFACGLLLHENAPDEEFSNTTHEWSLTIASKNATLRRRVNHATMAGASQKQEIEATVPLNAPVPGSARDWLPSLCAACPNSGMRWRLPEFEDTGVTGSRRKPNGSTGIQAWLVLGLLCVVGIPMQIINGIAAGVASAWDRVRGKKR